MATPEQPGYYVDGEPGAVVDECYLAGIGSFLSYTYCDKDGWAVIYITLPRDASPEDISKILYNSADALIEKSPPDMSWEEIIRRVDEMREQAARVPGLRNGKRK